MRALSASEVLAAWEAGTRQHPVDRALTVLSACSGESRDRLARASIGRRDAWLLQAYEHLFGATLEAFAECPRCSERLEYNLPVRGFAEGEADFSDEVALSAGDVSLRMRLPDSLDLAAIRECSDTAFAGRLLAERCIVEARRGDTPISAAELPEAIVDQVSARLAEADPRAEILIDLTCAACRHSWQVLLDIESFLWARLNSLAKRLFVEVHTLASAYGWSEADILAMSGVRRQAYLEMVS
jgi:hypothetical protein